MVVGGSSNIRPASYNLRMPCWRASIGAVCRGPLHHSSVLVHGLDLVRQSGGDNCAFAVQHVRRSGAVQCAWVHPCAIRRRTHRSRSRGVAVETPDREYGLVAMRVASPTQQVVLVCAAQVLVQLGANFWPALLPTLTARWSLTYSEAGWITASFYGAYIIAVPILVTLTDRVDAKRVYLSGVALTVAGHLLFALHTDGLWSAIAARC